MEIEVTRKEKLNVKYIRFDIPIRPGDFNCYKDDIPVCQAIENDGHLTLTIDIETGVVYGRSLIKHDVRIYSKVCDEGYYMLLDEYNCVVYQFRSYVPDILSCIDNGFGDYLSMVIHPNGSIDNWDSDKIHDIETMQKFESSFEA
jgi:hypothetical protein